MAGISINELSAAVEAELQAYSEEAAELMKKAVDEVAEEAKTEIDSHITFRDRTGKYRKSLGLETVEETRYRKKKVWRAKGRRASLTHLLENGHATKNGGRTRAFPHIIYGDRYVEKHLDKRIKEKIERAN